MGQGMLGGNMQRNFVRRGSSVGGGVQFVGRGGDSVNGQHSVRIGI